MFIEALSIRPHCLFQIKRKRVSKNPSLAWTRQFFHWLVLIVDEVDGRRSVNRPSIGRRTKNATCRMGREDVIRKLLKAGAHLGYTASEASLKRDYLQDLERIARARYETLFAVRQCFRRRQPFCVVEEGKKDMALSKRVADIIRAYKTIKVRP